MRVVQVSFHRDRLARPAHELVKAWPTLFDVARAASNAGVDVRIVQAHHTSEKLDADVLTTFTPHVLSELERARPDVVHVHGLCFPGATRALRRRLPRAAVLVQDHGGGLPPRWRRPVVRWGLRHISGVAFTAQMQAAAYAFALPPAIPVFEVLESSTRFRSGDVHDARASTRIHGDPIVLSIGGFIPRKDPVTALTAIRLAAAELPGLQLWCCHYEDTLRDEVNALIFGDPSLRDRVHMLGRVPHAAVELLCRASDIFLSASHNEGSGYSLLESIACGATPVITDIPPHRRITRDAAIGRLVPLRDPAAMARALVDVARAARSKLRDQARAHFEAHLTFDAIGRELRHAYEAIAQ